MDGQIGDSGSGSNELDVRSVPKPQRHPQIFARFASLEPGASFVLVNSHDPKHLREEFERDHPGAYDWSYLESGPVWRIRITRLAASDLPRILYDTNGLTNREAGSDQSGAVWKLEMSRRDLDANVIQLPPGGRIESHQGPDLDVLMHVLAGSGTLVHALDSLGLTSGALVWLPRRSQRSIEADGGGMTYLTVHPRRPGLGIESATPVPRSIGLSGGSGRS
jgi:uncharacterized protein (DUF2249 family)/quercetin dioxygenase-like cupin family protein